MPLVEVDHHSLCPAVCQVKEFLVPLKCFAGDVLGRNATVTEGLGNQGELVLVSAL